MHHAYLASLLVGHWPGIHRIHVIYVCMMTIPVRLHQTVPGLLAGTLEMANGQTNLAEIFANSGGQRLQTLTSTTTRANTFVNDN